MGAYSELDIDLRYDNSPFDEDETFDEDGLSAFAEAGDGACEASESDPPAEPQPEPAPVPQTQSAPEQKAGQTVEVKPDTEKSAKAEVTQEEEAAARKAHEEAEAKRKAEWDAKQRQKKEDEAAALAKLDSMNPDELMAASTQRVGVDTEKLTRRNMKECVAEHIQTMCLDDLSFSKKVMHPRKSMIRCFQYITRKAWEYVQDELKASGIKPGPGQQGYGCDVPDDLCYQWAVDYFNDPEAKEDHEEEEKFVPKPYCGPVARKSKKSASKGKKAADAKGTAPGQPAAQKKQDEVGQIAFGDFSMPEAKAG